MKFPRTPHLPGSKATADDVWANFTPSGRYIATEKMDGSNIMMNNKKFITRKGGVSSADWTFPARLVHQNIAHLIPQGHWIAGELLTWRKSIAYENLPGDFVVFGVIKGNTVLPWDDVERIASDCGLPLVRVLSGPESFESVVQEARRSMDSAGDSMEGFVVRPAESFSLPHYAKHVAKFVGSHHEAIATSNGKNGVVRAATN